MEIVCRMKCLYSIGGALFFPVHCQFRLLAAKSKQLTNKQKNCETDVSAPVNTFVLVYNLSSVIGAT